MQLIEISPEYGLAYTEDFAGIRAKLKDKGQMDALLAQVQDFVLCEELDPTKPEDALRIRANVAFAKKVKTRLEKIRTEAVADLKKEPKAIEDAVRPYVKRLDALAETLYRPLAEMDARADKLRILADLPNRVSFAPLEQLRQELTNAQAMDDSAEVWLERATEAVQVKQGVIDALETMIAKKTQEEAEKAELEALRAAKAEVDRKAQLEAARLEGERVARERMQREAAEAVAAEDKARVELRKAEHPKAQAKAETPTAGPAQDGYASTYEALRAVIASNGFNDLSKTIIQAIKDGRIPNITTNLK